MESAYAAYIAKYQGYAKQYYVSPSGTGSSCSQSSPCSLNTGVGLAGPGVVIWFNSGSYNLGSSLSTNASGTSTNHAAFVSLTYGGAMINNTAASANNYVWSVNGSYDDLVGFNLTGPGQCEGFDGYAGSGAVAATYAYNQIHDVANKTSGCGTGVGGGGIMPGVGGNNVMIDNVIWNIGAAGNAYVHGIYRGGSPGDRISNNVIYNASGACIQSWDGGEGGVLDYNIQIVNNTLVTCGTWGIVIGGNSCSSNVGSQTFVGNNIVWASPSIDILAIVCGGTASSDSFDNNLIWGSSAVNIPGGTQSGTISANPMLVNPISPASGGDFHLQAGSPAIGAGTTTNAPATDIDGTVRGNAPSIGAYE